MGTIGTTLGDLLFSIADRVSFLETRVRNHRRTGKIAEVGTGENKGKYRVELSQYRGRPYITDWIRPRTIGAAGVKIDVIHSVGEQVDVVSSNGEITDARIDFATYSEENERENGNDVPLHIKIGDTIIEASGDAVTIKAAKIVLEGNVHLGGEGGQLLHRKGDEDDAGDKAVGSATKVWAV